MGSHVSKQVCNTDGSWNIYTTYGYAHDRAGRKPRYLIAESTGAAPRREARTLSARSESTARPSP